MIKEGTHVCEGFIVGELIARGSDEDIVDRAVGEWENGSEKSGGEG